MSSVIGGGFEPIPEITRKMVFEPKDDITTREIAAILQHVHLEIKGDKIYEVMSMLDRIGTAARHFVPAGKKL